MGPKKHISYSPASGLILLLSGCVNIAFVDSSAVCQQGEAAST